MLIYLAAPLFSEAERRFNIQIKTFLEKEGYSVFLPQESCNFKNSKEIYSCCIENLESSDLVLAVFDGPQIDDGTAFECGFATGRGIPVIGLRTDFRRVGEGTAPVNSMLLEGILGICKDLICVKEKLNNLTRGSIGTKI